MKKALGAMAVLLLLAAPAMATFNPVSNIVTLSGDGNHWLFNGLNYNDTSNPLRLFEPAGTTNSDGSPDLSIWTHNNSSPIAGSGYPDYVPSPAYPGSVGESFDIEGLFWEYNADTDIFQVWVVTSIAPDGTVYGAYDNHYHLGDVFINTDDNMSTGAEGYEYALLGFNADPGYTAADNMVWGVGGDSWGGAGRDAGALVALGSGSDLYGINGPNSYASYPEVTDDTNPWAGEELGTTLSGNQLDFQHVTGTLVDNLDNNPDASGQGTYIYHWSVTLDLGTGDALDDVLELMSIPGAFHVAVQCGNDAADNGGGPGGGNDIPAPGALILGILGAGLVGLRRRMRG